MAYRDNPTLIDDLLGEFGELIFSSLEDTDEKTSTMVVARKILIKVAKEKKISKIASMIIEKPAKDISIIESVKAYWWLFNQLNQAIAEFND
ncbi:MAG TPA: hypothetical protein VJ958_05365 [Atribacterota bacterium]|nr:hypothetical protein [Atribacterota bacterium]